MDRFKTRCIWLLLICMLHSSLWAVERERTDELQLCKMSLAPVSEPVPALKVRLLPGVLDQKIGNAALFYLAAAAECPNVEKNDLQGKISRWRDMAVDDWPLEEVQEVLSQFDSSFHHIHLAALRNRCEWEMPIEDGFNMKLPSLRQYRNIAKVLTLKIRLAIHEKDYDLALTLLREGFTMGRNIAEGATIIQDLVGVAISAILLNELELLMEHPEAPNLYWALTAMSQPFIDMRPSLEYEQQMIFVEFPVLKDISESVWTAEQAKQEVSKMMTKALSLDLVDDMPFMDVLPMAWVMVHYADAKNFLAKRGMPANKIEAFPAAQAVLLYQVRQYIEARDSIFKWFHLSFPLAYPQIEAAEQAMHKDMVHNKLKTNVFFMLLPALERVYFLQTRFDRHIAMLRTIEAIRDYAAHHQGVFPKTLQEVTKLPVPSDPMTGVPFVYKRESNTRARLEGAKIAVRKSRQPIYELELNN